MTDLIFVPKLGLISGKYSIPLKPRMWMTSHPNFTQTSVASNQKPKKYRINSSPFTKKVKVKTPRAKSVKTTKVYKDQSYNRMDRSISRISPNRPNTTAGRARNLEGKMQSNFETRRHIDVSFDSPDDSYYLMQDLKPSLLPRPIRNRPITAPKPNIEFQL